MKELDTCLRDLVAVVRAVYQPTVAHDAMVRAAILELTQLDEAAPTVAPTPSLLRPAADPEPVQPPAAPVRLNPATEHELLAILEAPASDMTIAAAFAYKERALRVVFASLRPVCAYALRQRLLRVSDGDVLAARFGRLAPERRDRLIAVLGDARRREAIEQARGAR
jgi:hypothetical protein